MSLNWGGGLPMDGGSLTGQITWGTGLGAITHILGPTDQTLTIKSGTGRGMAIGLAGQTISSNSNITWPTGLGAITHITGPSDQNLSIDVGGATRNIVLGASATNALVSWGPATSSYPALRRSSATLEAITADASAYAEIHLSNLRLETAGVVYWNSKSIGLSAPATRVLKVTDNAGTGYGRVQAHWPRREFGVAKTPGTAATVTAYGGAPTHTLSGTASNVSDSTGHYVQLSVDTAIGGINIEATEVTKTENGPIITFVIKTGAVLPIATERLWVGLGSASLAAADSPSGIHVAAFRYAPTTDTTAFWRAVTNDGGADAGTETTSTVAIAVSTRYILTIDATNSASITFYVDGALIATHATNVPTATQALGTACHVTDVAAGDTKELLISSIHFETN